MPSGKAIWMGFLRAWSRGIPLSAWLAATGQKLFLPFYHTVSDDSLAHIQHLYALRNLTQFEQDLDYLLRHFEPIDLQQLIAFAQEKKPLPKAAFFLSFDDGLSECYSQIAPILQKKGIPATFFINSDFIDNQAIMFRYQASWLVEKLKNKNWAEIAAPTRQVLLEFNKTENTRLLIPNNQEELKKSLLSVRHNQLGVLEMLIQIMELDFVAYQQNQRIYMTSQEIQSLINQGFTIGAHSCNHPLYARLPLPEQQTQTFDCQNIIQKKFSLDYRSFAFPFSDDGVGAGFFDWAFSAGQFDLTFGGAGLKQEAAFPQHFQRFPMETESVLSPRALLHSEYAHYFFKRMLGKHQTQRIR